jgi:hypothetical protein
MAFRLTLSKYLCEATPRGWQGVALLEAKLVLNGKAEPFRTVKRQSREESVVFLIFRTPG